MRPEDRAVVSYEPNLFYRHLIHAFGAPGLAMTRIVKSDDDELEEIAEDFLIFHDEIPDEETMGVKISFEVTPTLDSDSKFTRETQNQTLQLRCFCLDWRTTNSSNPTEVSATVKT